MRTVVLGIPHLASMLDGESLLRQKLPYLQQISEQSEVFVVSPTPGYETPEAMWLGLPPGKTHLAPGPLAVSAFGADPPERSVHFHLSLMSCSEQGILMQPSASLSDQDLRVLLNEIGRLNTKLITFVRGEGFDHALVWESGSLDMGTTPAEDAIGQSVSVCYPEGDGETKLRRFIDDSVNLLSDLELNRRRIGEGLEPVNIAWPWGQGHRTAVPNLALRRGEPVAVHSRSLRLHGLARLAGYAHHPRSEFGNGFNMSFDALFEAMLSSHTSFALFDAVERANAAVRLEEGAWWVRELDSHFIQRLCAYALEDPLALWILAPGDETSPGLGLKYDSTRRESSIVPFDERALDDGRLRRLTLWETVDHALRGVASSRLPSPPL